MVNHTPITTVQEHEEALARIDELMDAEAGTVEGDELDALVDLVVEYERKHVDMGQGIPPRNDAGGDPA